LRVQNLQEDFGALVTPGLELAFNERVQVELDGHLLGGGHTRRKVPVCGPAAFVVLKALAFGDRIEPKDAFDLVYVVRHTAGRGAMIAERLRRHAQSHPKIVARALGFLIRDFDAPDDIGPLRAAEFAAVDASTLEDDKADAHGFVQDLLREAVSIGLSPAEI